MDFDFYSSRLADLNEFSKEFFKKRKKILQKRFQFFNELMQVTAVSRVQFGQLNDKRFYFPNFSSVFTGFEKWNFLKQESNKIGNNPRMHVLKQIFAQSPMFYILNSTIISITKGWKSTKEQILNGSWKWLQFMMVNLAEIF